MPTACATKWDSNPTPFQDALKDMNLPAGTDVTCVYLAWLQLELSACVIGANRNAVAKAYKAGVVDDTFLDLISAQRAQSDTANLTDGPAAVELARQRAKTAFLVEIQTKIKTL